MVKLFVLNIKGNRDCQKGFILAGSLMVVLFLSILIGVVMMRADMQLRLTNQRAASQEAFYGAELALNQAIFELRRNSAWQPGQGTEPAIVDVAIRYDENDPTVVIGYYSLDVVNAPPLNGWETRWIRAIGRDTFQKITTTILGRVLVENPARFAVSTLGDLNIASGAVLNADVLASNISFKINDPSQPIVVNGNIFFLKGGEVDGEEHSSITFTEGAAQQITEAPSLTFAGVDADRYRDLSQSLVESGNGVFLEGDVVIDLSRLDELVDQPPDDFLPQVIYVEGNATVVGEYDHSLLIVTGGNIFIDGNIIPNVSDDSIRPQLGLLANKDVIIADGVLGPGQDLTLEAFVMADGEGADADGIFKTEGDFSSLGTLNFTGSISARGDNRTAVDLNAFATRNYSFNPELTSNRQIPFLPFIVNLVQWQQIENNAPFPPVE